MKKATTTIAPILIILISIIIFFWPNFTWPAVNITPTVGTNDFTDLNYPYRHFQIENFKKGKFPLWAPEISTGYPLLAAGVALYPLNFLAVMLPLNESVNFTIFTTYFLIGLFTYFYLLEIKLSRKSAIFGAIAMMFGGHTLNQLLHWDMVVTFAYFMGEMFLIEKMVKSGKVIYSLLLGVFLGIQFLGGHPQMLFYSLLFLGLYWLLITIILRQKFIKSLCLFILFILLGVGMGMAQLLPEYEFTKNSDRGSGLSEASIARFNFPASDISTFVMPFASFDDSQTIEAFHHNGWPQDERYTYMGILALIFAFLAILTQFRRKPRVIFFTGTLIFFLLLSFGTGSVFGFLLTKPPLNLFRLPLRFLMLVDVSLALLAAFGFEEVMKWLGKLNKKGRYALVGASLLIIASFIDLWYWGTSWKLHPAVSAKDWYQTPEVVKFLKEHLQNQERATTEYYYYPSVKIFLTQRHLWDEPQTLINLRNLLPAFNNLLYDIPMAVGAANSGGIKIKRYNDLEMETFFNGIEYTSLDKIKLSDSYLFINRLTGVRYVIFSKELPSGLGLSKVFQTDFKNGQDNIYVYEFFDYYPRTFMVGQAKVEEPEKIKEHLLKVDFDPKQTVFLEEKTDWGAQGAMAASAQFEKYEDQEVKIKTQASSDGFLFLSDAYYPGWKAYVDGQEKKIYLANYAFRAVEVPQGEHEVIFKYEPTSFWWGIRISLGVTGLVTLGVIFLGLKGLIRKRN